MLLEQLLSLLFFLLELPGGDRALTRTEVVLTYSYAENSFSSTSPEILLLKRTPPQSFNYALTYNGTQNTVGTSKSVEYTFSQKEHGGGDCNCPTIHFDMKCSSSQR